QRQIENVHSIGDRGLDGVEDVFAAGVNNVAGKDVVVAQPGTRRDSGHVTDADAIYDSIEVRVVNSGRDPGRMSPMVLNGLCFEALWLGLVVEYLRDNEFFRDVLAVQVLMI